MNPFPSSLISSPAPGECLYSVAAHLAEHWSNCATAAVKTFLGSFRVSRDYPGNLDALARVLAFREQFSGRNLALKHTLLPLHFPFLQEQDRQRLISEALSGAKLQLQLGIAPSRLCAPRALRFCPACVAKDRELFGRAYWHIEHQIAGIHVCGLDATPIRESSVVPDWRPARGRYVTAESAVRTESRPVLEQPTPKHTTLAEDICWMLKQDECLSPGPARIHALHRSLALSKGYSMKNGSVALQALRRDLNTYYGESYIQSLQGADHSGGWIAALTRAPRAHQQPLRHLLLARFFGLSIGDFLARAMDTAPADTESKPHKFRIRSSARLNKLLPAKRAAWLQVMESESGSAREGHATLYAWLWRNDRSWLRNHRKDPVCRQPNYERWIVRDRNLAASIRNIAETIRKESNSRVSRNAIAARSERPSWLVRDHPHLPLTNAALAGCSETPVEHALRRIAQQRERHGAGLALWRMRQSCGISVALSKEPRVAEALASAALKGPFQQ